MPIRPENLHRYPPNWPQISRQRKDDAGWRCECDGRCGRPAEHLDDEQRCVNRHGEPAFGTGSRVVLTTAHLNHIPEDCRPENLRAMCQGCHLHYDREHHAATRRANRAGASPEPVTIREVAARQRAALLARCDRLADDHRAVSGLSWGVAALDRVLRACDGETDPDRLAPPADVVAAKQAGLFD